MKDVELVIKIPEGIMEYIKNNGCLAVGYNDEVAKAIKNGKSLDSVLDKIRTEINKLPDLNPDYEMDKTIHVSKWAVHGIIDKYKAGKSGEK